MQPHLSPPFTSAWACAKTVDGEAECTGVKNRSPQDYSPQSSRNPKVSRRPKSSLTPAWCQERSYQPLQPALPQELRHLPHHPHYISNPPLFRAGQYFLQNLCSNCEMRDGSPCAGLPRKQRHALITHRRVIMSFNELGKCQHCHRRGRGDARVKGVVRQFLRPGPG
jgi:hypothetical protein